MTEENILQLIETVQCSDCDEIIYQTSTPPPADKPLIKIEALRCKQKGKVYYLTDLQANIVSMLTDVPRFDWSQSYQKMANAILSYGHGLKPVDTWQRDLIMGKIDNIARWWEKSETVLVNNAVISFKEAIQRPVQRGSHQIMEPVHVREVKESKYGKKELVTIEVDNWLSSVCPAGHSKTADDGSPIYFDRCPNCDCDWHKITWRPAYIIDGQHRIIGIQNPPSLGSTEFEQVNTEPIPVTILGYSEAIDSSPISPSEQAKIFTEISGKATPLDDLHRLFLFYVFKTGVPGENMSEPPAGSTNPLRNAYETILRLTGSGIADNPLQNRVKVLTPRKGGPSRTSSLSFDRALKWFELWFSSTSIWSGVNPSDAAREVVDLVNAITKVWTGNSTHSGIPYWQFSPPPAPSGIFSHPGGVGKMSAFLRIFFDIYSEIRNTVSRPTRINFQNLFRSKLYNSRSPVGQVAWDGPGWNPIRSPDQNYNLLKAAIRDILTDGGKVLYDLQHHPSSPASFNAYINLDPTIYEVQTSFGPVSASNTQLDVSSPTPSDIQISWRNPLLALRQVTMSAREGNRTTIPSKKIDISPGEITTVELRQSDGDFSGTTGSLLIVELVAENHKGEQDPPFSIEFKFQ